MKIQNKELGENNPVFIIAEISCNHLQNKDYAIQLIKNAKEAGADAVKFQAYTPDTITFDFKKDIDKERRVNSKELQSLDKTIWKGEYLYQLYEKAYTPWEWFKDLQQEAEKQGLIFFASPFDETAVDMLEELNVPCYKVASFEINHIPLLKKIAQTKKPVFISTGVATPEDLDLAVKTIKKYHNNIILLKCTSAYPSPPEELNLKSIIMFKERYNCLVGLSDHTLKSESAILSIGLGCCAIEKHLKLSKKVTEEKSLDDAFSLDINQFSCFVRKIKDSEVMLGKKAFKFGKETENHLVFKRSIYVVKDIKAREEFTNENIKVIRPNKGLHPKQYEKLIGRKAFVNIPAGKPLTWDLVEQEMVM
jgi:pseudaminic acid synthase